jgi:hypothetical protein
MKAHRRINAPLGFVILSHADADQLARLVCTLNRVYRHPPIAVHHDFSQTAVDIGQFGANVGFVQPSVRTKWAHISIVHAALAALRTLYDRALPDWFTLLSAADYPTMPAEAVVAELHQSAFDLYMDHQLVERDPSPQQILSPSRLGTHSVHWRRMAYDRYVAKTFQYPSLTKRLKRTHRRIIIRNESMLRTFNWFPANWKCFAGDHWFTGNRKVADALMAASSTHPQLFEHFTDRFCPDESIYHTILCNHPGLRICNDNKRYADWMGQDAHPRLLDHSDLEMIRSSRSHFARKFSATHCVEVLASIDRML